MEKKELMGKFSLSEPTAEVVTEFIRESKPGSMPIVMAVATVLSAEEECKKTRGEKLTLDVAQKIYDVLPEGIKVDYPGNYLTCCIETLLCGRKI